MPSQLAAGWCSGGRLPCQDDRVFGWLQSGSLVREWGESECCDFDSVKLCWFLEGGTTVLGVCG